MTGVLSSKSNILIDGHLAAATKSFVIEHPSIPGKKLQYGSLESPYHGIRLTGKGKVVSGDCTILLPDYISDLIIEDNINVQLTNINHTKTLYVKEIDKHSNMFTVGADDQDNNEYEFFWSFTAERADIPKLIVEY